MLKHPFHAREVPPGEHHELGEHLLTVRPIRAVVVAELRADRFGNLRVGQLWPLRAYQVRDVEPRTLIEASEAFCCFRVEKNFVPDLRERAGPVRRVEIPADVFLEVRKLAGRNRTVLGEHVEGRIVKSGDPALTQLFTQNDAPRFHPTLRIRRAAWDALAHAPHYVCDVWNAEPETQYLLLEESADCPGLRLFFAAVIGEHLHHLARAEELPLRWHREFLSSCRIVAIEVFNAFLSGVPHLSRNVGPVIALTVVHDEPRLRRSRRQHCGVADELPRNLVPK